jgi:hypothetical protein
MVSVSKLSECVSYVNSEVITTRKLVDEGLNRETKIDFSGVTTELNNFSSKFNSLESIIKDSINADIENNKLPIIINNSEVVHKMDLIGEKINTINFGIRDIRNQKPEDFHDQRISLLISQLDDISKQVDIVGKVVIRLLPKDKTEELIKDEFDRGTIERIQAQAE